jgi:hypothetical protein
MKSPFALSDGVAGERLNFFEKKMRFGGAND